MKNKVLYMKDSSTLRIGLCTYVIIMEIFQIVWIFFISPISDKYLFGLQNIATIVSLSFSIIYLIAFVILLFLDLEKHWKKYYIFIGSLFIIDMLLLDITYYFNLHTTYEAGMQTNFVGHYLSVIFTYLFSYGISALLCFLVLTEKRVFKYLVIICFVILTCSSIVNIFANLIEISESSAGRWITIHGKTLADWEEPFYYITNAIQNIPTFNLAFLLLSFFIKVKKPQRRSLQKVNNFAVQSSYDHPVNNQQQNQIQTAYTQSLPSQPTQVKYCPKCGEQADIESKFCRKCGNLFPQF